MNGDVDAILRRIETSWVDVGSVTLKALVKDHGGDQVYAAAFWLLYSDYTRVLVPALAANVESNVVVHTDDEEPWSTRWVPAEWRWPVLDEACDAMKLLYAQFTSALVGADRVGWDEALTAHEAVLARAARSLTEALHQSEGELALRCDFVVGVIDDQRESAGMEALLRASIEPARLARLDGIIPDQR